MKDVSISFLKIRRTGSLLLFAAALGVLIGLPAYFAVSMPAADFGAVQGIVSASEQWIGAGLLGTAFLLLLRRMRRGQFPAIDGGGPISGASLAVFLPAIPLLVYVWLFSEQAYSNLFLSDQDFTNISSAINNTARGDGLLTTAFLQTGAGGSYLGHHFSPVLFLYVPVYWFFHAAGRWLAPEVLLEWGNTLQPTHWVYAVLLWITLLAALWLWTRFVRLELRDPLAAVLVSALLVSAYPLWRLSLSYHYELPALVFSAAAFLALRRRRMLAYWVALFLWMSCKEDIAVYVALFGIYLAVHRRDGGPRIGLATAIVGVLYFLLASGPFMDLFAGAEKPNWASVWQDVWLIDGRSARPTFFIVAAFALLPLLNGRLFWIVIAPILALHYFSYHPWHHNFLGHYSYDVLPFLMFGTIRSAQRLGRIGRVFGERLREFALVAALGISLLAASADRYMPIPGLPEDERYSVVHSLLERIPRGACVQTQAPFSAHVPLHARVFPLMIPETNPFHDRLPGPHNFDRFYFRDAICRRYYLLLDPDDPIVPFYVQEHLDAFANFARRNLFLESEREGLHLYVLPLVDRTY